MQHFDSITIDKVQGAIASDDQMADTSLDILIFWSQRTAFSQYVQLLYSLYGFEIPIYRVLRGFFSYLPVPGGKVMFRCRLYLDTVFFQRLIPCLASNSLVNSPNGLPGSDSA